MAGLYKTMIQVFTLNNVPFFLFIVISLITGIYFNRKKDAGTFLTGPPNMGVFKSAVSITVTNIGAVTLLVYPLLVYKFGISCLWTYIGILTGRILFTFFALHLRATAGKKTFYTITDYFVFKFGNKAAFFVLTALFLWYLGETSFSFGRGGAVISELTGIPFTVITILICAVCIAYLIFGGFKSLISTDMVHFFILSSILIVVIYTVKCGLKVPLLHYDLFNAGIVKITAFFLLGIFQQFASQDNWHRICVMKNDDTVKQSFIIAGFIEFCFALLLTYLGLAALTYFPGEKSPYTGIFKLFTEMIPPSISGIVAVAFYACILSTVDTFIFNLSLNIGNNVFTASKNKKEKIVKVTRIAIPLVTVTAVILAFIFKDTNKLILPVKAIGLAVAPIVIFCWTGRGHKTAIITTLSLITLLIGTLSVLGFITPTFFLISILCSFLIYGLTTLFIFLYNYIKPEEQLESLEEVE